MVLLWFVATLGVTYVANTAVGLVDLQVFPAGSRIEVLSLPQAPTTEPTASPPTQASTPTERLDPTTTTTLTPSTTSTTSTTSTPVVLPTTTVARSAEPERPAAAETTTTTTEAPVPTTTTTEAPVPTTTTTVPPPSTTGAPVLVSLVSDTLVLRTGGGYEERLFSGGLEPYQLEVIAGSLPAGLVLNDSGTLEGSPTGSGIFDVTVRLTDAAGQIKENLLSFIIREYRAISARGGSVTVIVTGDSVGFFSALQAQGFEPAEVHRSGPLVVEVVFPPTSGDEASWVRCEAADTVRCAKG